MRKKLILILTMLIVTTGCVNVQNASVEKITDEILKSKFVIYNHNNKGFKYYLPNGMTVSYKDEYNEIIKSNGYTYYLYVDLVRYFAGESLDYNEEDAYLSSVFTNDDKKGIINVYYKEKNSYLVNVEYNYAKVEVYVKKQDINEAIANALTITTTIKYNKSIIENMIGKDLSSVEEEVNVFEIKDDSSSLLQIDDTYQEDEKYDSEVIR
ncbi:MAG: hypothetical protein IJS56_03745 [Bacilli bacterium]|nr:hypothetical protein [Bacilli bacterium]